jgi:hypothetical protein
MLALWRLYSEACVGCLHVVGEMGKEVSYICSMVQRSVSSVMRDGRLGHGVTNEVYIYSPFGAEGGVGSIACVLVRGGAFVGWKVVEEVCVG